MLILITLINPFAARLRYETRVCHTPCAGHPLAEVRSRSLRSIVFKLSNGLLSYSELAEEREFLAGLLEWFNQEEWMMESHVLTLLQHLAKVSTTAQTLASYPECEAKHVHVDYIYIVQYVQISWKLTVMISDFLFHIKKFESPSANLLSMYRYMQQGGIPSEPECACVYVCERERERERERDRSSKQHY